LHSNSGIFLLDKPAGISSFRALDSLKRALDTSKVGHTGTLDPFATGLLIALSGKLTKAAYLFSDMDKGYETVIRFGTETDTLDVRGRVVDRGPIPPYNDIERAVGSYIGTITQIPPAFSAVKISGSRSYRLARKGLKAEIPAREVRIHSFRILDWSPPNLRAYIGCSSGTYIRSLSRDIGIACGSKAFCYSLRRVSIGPFSVQDAVESDQIAKSDGYDPIEFARIAQIPTTLLSDEVGRQLKKGISPDRLKRWFPGIETPTFCMSSDEKALAMLDIKEGRLACRIVF